MSKKISLDTRELIEVVDSRGVVTGFFHWNPADLDIVKCCDRVKQFFDELSLSENVSDEEMYQLSEETKEQFNFLLGSEDAADALFSGNIFSPRDDGRTQAEYVFDVITKFIESEFKVRIKKVNKYVAKYRKEDQSGNSVE